MSQPTLFKKPFFPPFSFPKSPANSHASLANKPSLFCKMLCKIDWLGKTRSNRLLISTYGTNNTAKSVSVTFSLPLALPNSSSELTKYFKQQQLDSSVLNRTSHFISLIFSLTAAGSTAVVSGSVSIFWSLKMWRRFTRPCLVSK